MNELVFIPWITNDLALLSKPGYLPNYQNQTDEENKEREMEEEEPKLLQASSAAWCARLTNRQNDSLDKLL